MKIRKTVWIFSMAVLFAILLLIVNSRIQLTSEIIISGNEKTFVETSYLKNPLEDYGEASEADLGKYEELDFPDIDIADWRYILISGQTPRNSYTPEVVEIGSTGKNFDADGYIMLKKLMSGAREAGFEPYIGDAYISYTAQQQIFNSKASELSSEGNYSYDEAAQLAREIVPYPGTSEHQTGLCVDIFDKEYETLDYSKMDSEFFKWMDEHCTEYGFIKRFPENKQAITGWYEPWHYRYVGVTAAEFIMENGLCLEEFLAHYD